MFGREGENAGKAVSAIWGESRRVAIERDEHGSAGKRVLKVDIKRTRAFINITFPYYDGRPLSEPRLAADLERLATSDAFNKVIEEVAMIGQCRRGR